MNIEEQIEEKYLFKKIGSIGQKTFLIRSCPDQMRDGYEYVGDITNLIQKEPKNVFMTKEEILRFRVGCLAVLFIIMYAVYILGKLL